MPVVIEKYKFSHGNLGMNLYNDTVLLGWALLFMLMIILASTNMVKLCLFV